MLSDVSQQDRSRSAPGFLWLSSDAQCTRTKTDRDRDRDRQTDRQTECIVSRRGSDQRRRLNLSQFEVSVITHSTCCSVMCRVYTVPRKTTSWAVETETETNIVWSGIYHVLPDHIHVGLYSQLSYLQNVQAMATFSARVIMINKSSISIN